jgi:transcriptional regulator with XRE-family HTH domain
VGRGLSQRELASQAKLGQSRLAKIEAGTADLRTSTLMQLARALNLELVLVPRRVLPAVLAMSEGVSSPVQEPERRSVRGTPRRTLHNIQQRLKALTRISTGVEVKAELERAQRASQALMESASSLPELLLDPLRRTLYGLGDARIKKNGLKPSLTKAAEQLEELQRTLPKLAHLEKSPRSQRSAYSLEDEELP